VGKNTYKSSVKIVDTTPPTATPLNLSFGFYEPGSGVSVSSLLPAEDFTSNITDVSPVTVTYQTPPDLSKIGVSEVDLILTDSAGNTTNLSANLEVQPVKGYLEYQTMEKQAVTVEDFKADNFQADIQVTLLTEIPPEWLTKVGEHEVKLNVNGKEILSTLAIKDTTPPTATPKNLQIWLGKDLIPTDFVGNISDNSDVAKVTSEFETNPDFTLEGQQAVNIILTDENGNKAVVNSSVTITKDIEPPVITPVKELYAAIGEKITYRTAVTVTDNSITPTSNDVALEVDSSAVNTTVPGTYAVVYTATDGTGNVATLSLNVVISEITEEMVLQEVDKIIGRIITEGMTDPQKAEAIQRWVRNHVDYITHGSKKSEYIEAYHGFTQLSGDCFTFYACSKVLLDRVGIENKIVQRIPGQVSTHYWNKIKIDGQWWHFDACPYIKGFPAAGYMMTEEDLVEFTRQRGREYYTYDHSLY
jgi:hypothetical protein